LLISGYCCQSIKKGKKVEELSSLGITDKYDEKLGKGFLKGKDFVVLIAESLTVGIVDELIPIHHRLYKPLPFFLH